MTRKLGWQSQPDEGHLTKLLRSLLLERMAMFDDTDVIAEAQRRFDLHIKGEEQIPADFRSTVYQAVLRSGFRPNLQLLMNLYGKETLLEEQDRIASALGTIEDESALQEVIHQMNIDDCIDSSSFCDCQSQVLSFALSSDVRSQHTLLILSSMGSTKLGRDIAWNFFKEHVDLLNQRFSGIFLISRLIKSLTEHFTTEEKAIEVVQFFRVSTTFFFLLFFK